ncbi:hypothetical protein COCSUDRAFT_59280 [Coccomyxa subellipsoidea C-169]|uniref:Peptidase S1 domain-containing protein n=1 Tax=Coccomyxa subellipsoidea (strain C-169) TaxID=574566 RepID=I0Z800_COCSC|nr:hypothetical protein COCSUDRAFT_59280 [Coccomyxa subellipsoidea C-169]EIE26769.1 hypothetical protein COCSUDRAFT_59280 [Coccomyxa subellipsoidea C-169]|eukprot:XP_005651313.1 hypothetical protein COCSUDRAFT_59280 [Coccomyxa subellipsoidea C-169]
MQSEGALAHMILFSKVQLARGSELVIFSPSAVSNYTDVSVRLASSVHAKKTRRRLLQERVTTLPIGTQLPVPLFQQNGSSIFGCTPSVECGPQYKSLAAGVVTIYAVDPMSKTVGLCTDKGQLQGFEYWLVIFNYNAPCNYTQAPPIRDLIQGVSLSFYDSAADVLLMAIPNLIPNNFHTFVLGFNASDMDIPEEAIAIHHPGGAPAAISTVQGSGISLNFPKPNFPPSEVQPSDETHFQVTWTTGATIGGSSGSPLIDVATNRIVGVLTGGYSNCQDRTQPDYYGRLSVAWKHGLYQYLSSVVVLDKGTSFARKSTVAVMQANDTLPGRPVQHSRLALGMYPNVLHFLPNITSQTLTYYLLDPPLQNETVVTTAEIVSLRGNSIDVTPYVTLQNAHQNFTLADFGTQFVTQVNTTGLTDIVPGGLLRFLLLVNISSDLFPDDFKLMAVKGAAVSADTISIREGSFQG